MERIYVLRSARVISQCFRILKSDLANLQNEIHIVTLLTSADYAKLHRQSLALSLVILQYTVCTVLYSTLDVPHISGATQQ